MNDKLHKEYWQACEARKEYALAHDPPLQRLNEGERARFIELWKGMCAINEEHYVNAAHKLNLGERRRQWFLNCAEVMCVCAATGLHEEMREARARDEGYEEGRKAGIVEVFDRDRKNLEKGQKFEETPQGQKKREKAALLDRACELHHTGMPMREAVRQAAKELGMKINERSRMNQAYEAYSDWLKKPKPQP